MGSLRQAPVPFRIFAVLSSAPRIALNLIVDNVFAGRALQLMKRWPFEHDGWEAVSNGYVRHFGRLTSQTVPAALDAAGVTKETHLLDVCTGSGVLAGAALERGAQVVGLDFSDKLIQIAKRNLPLQATGFVDVAVEIVEQTWEFDEPLGMVTAFLEGAVRAGGLLRAQTEETRKALSTAVIDGMRQFRSSNGTYRVPMPALVGSGRR